MLGRYRNQPCECGSGKKMKNCCIGAARDAEHKTYTPEQLRHAKKSAVYFNKKYERLTNGEAVKKDA